MATDPTLFPLKFRRQQAEPIDEDIVFATTADRIAYLSNPRRYAGQVVADNEEQLPYYLNAARDAWLPFSSGGTSVIKWGRWPISAVIPAYNSKAPFHETIAKPIADYLQGDSASVTDLGLVEVESGVYGPTYKFTPDVSVSPTPQSILYRLSFSVLVTGAEEATPMMLSVVGRKDADGDLDATALFGQDFFVNSITPGYYHSASFDYLHASSADPIYLNFLVRLNDAPTYTITGNWTITEISRVDVPPMTWTVSSRYEDFFGGSPRYIDEANGIALGYVATYADPLSPFPAGSVINYPSLPVTFFFTSS